MENPFTVSDINKWIAYGSGRFTKSISPAFNQKYFNYGQTNSVFNIVDNNC